MLRISSVRITIFLHVLLFFIIASSVLNYWSVTTYALENWDAYYYQKANYISQSPDWQKILKDVLAFLLLTLSLLFPVAAPNLGQREDKHLIICYAFCFFALGISIMRCIYSNFDISIIFACLRPFIFITAIFVFCHRHLHFYYLRWVFESINFLAIIQAYYAFLQRQKAVEVNGLSWLDSGTARAVGTFIGPNSMGLFLALIFYLNLSVLPFHKLRYFILALCGVGIFFSGSRTSLLIIVILTFTKFYQKTSQYYKILKDKLIIRFTILPFFLILLPLSLSKINQISNRGDASSFEDGRIDMFAHYFSNTDVTSLMFGKHFGFGSNIILSLYRDQVSASDSFLADSTFTSIFVQFGLLGIFVIVGLIYVFLNHLGKPVYLKEEHYSYNYKYILGSLSKDKLGFLIYFLNTTATIIIFEFYAILPIIITLLFFFRLPPLVQLPSVKN